MLKNIADDVDKIKIDASVQNDRLEENVDSADGKIEVYAESLKKHPSEIGDLITLYMDIDGISVRTVCYTKNSKTFNYKSKIDSLSPYKLQETGY